MTNGWNTSKYKQISSIKKKKLVSRESGANKTYNLNRSVVLWVVLYDITLYWHLDKKNEIWHILLTPLNIYGDLLVFSENA